MQAEHTRGGIRSQRIVQAQRICFIEVAVKTTICRRTEQNRLQTLDAYLLEKQQR